MAKLRICLKSLTCSEFVSTHSPTYSFQNYAYLYLHLMVDGISDPVPHPSSMWVLYQGTLHFLPTGWSSHLWMRHGRTSSSSDEWGISTAQVGCFASSGLSAIIMKRAGSS